MLDRLRLMWRRLRGISVTDLSVIVRYRPGVFGDAFLAYWREAQYGPSPWSIGERQMLAAIISQANACAFCATTHADAAARTLPRLVVDEALDGDAGSPSLSPAFNAAASFATRLTREPGSISADDIRALEGAGVDRAKALSVVHLCTVYSIMNRVADALDFDIPGR